MLIRVAGLALTEAMGGQSRRDTVVSHTPRTGWSLLTGFAATGGFATGGSGVTSDLGGSEAQLTSNKAAASSGARRLPVAAAEKRCEQAMVNSIFQFTVLRRSFSYHARQSQSESTASLLLDILILL